MSFIFLASQRLKEHRNELQFLLGGRTRNRRELKKGLPNTRKVVWVWLDGDDDDDDDDARDRPPSARGKNSQPRPLFPALSIHHFKKKKKKSSYVAAAYVKWIEAAGGRAVPIRFYVSDGELRRLFDSVNGLIFPGE